MSAKYALAGLLLSACAGQAPAELTAIKDAVDARITYRPPSGQPLTMVHADAKAEGSCALFTANYMMDAIRAGYAGQARICDLKDGQTHSFFETDEGYVLDVRQKFVGTRADVGCI